MRTNKGTQDLDITEEHFLEREEILEIPKLKTVQEAAANCHRCPLWKRATQTVFGQGPTDAEVLFIGEQPGFQEDVEGKPFVGPAGRIFNEALAAAKIDRERIYVTNAVKHFKWILKGKKHMHDKPNATEILACQPWLEAEIQHIQPRLIVCLGSTAAQSVIRKDFKVTKERGKWTKSPLQHDADVMATIHPSSILRIPEKELRHFEMKHFIQDLKKITIRLAQQ